MYNRHVKFGLKIANRLGKKVRKFQGGGFDSHCRVLNRFQLLHVALVCCFSDRLRSKSMENVGKLQISPDKVSDIR